MSGEITSSGRRAVPAVVTVLVSVLVVAVAGFFLLSGNGSGTASPAPVSPTTSAPVSPSPSPSATKLDPPELPVEARSATTKGAAAFIRYFFETYNYAFAEVDAAPMQAISVKDCDFCRGVADDIETARDQGIRFEGADIQVTQAVAAPGDVAKGLVVNILLNQQAGRTIGSDGETRRQVKAAESVRADAGVRWTDRGWRVFAVTFPES